MSYATTKWARELSIPRAQKAVLTALAECENQKTGLCCPSQITLAGMTGFSERTVRRAVKELVASGLIARQQRFYPDGRPNTDAYTFDLDWTPRPQVTVTTGQIDHRLEKTAPPDMVSVTTGQKVQSAPYIEQEEEQEEEKEVLRTTSVTFAEFWLVWPRSESKKAAEAAWRKAVKVTSPEAIVAAASAYANHPDRPPKQFVPYGASWLNAERWNDPLPQAPQASNRRETPEDRMRATLALVTDEQKAINE